MNGSTAGVMKENGTTMICKDQGFTNGMMEGCTKDNIKMIRKMGTEYIAGKIEDNTRGIG